MKRQKSERGPGSEFNLDARNPPISKKKRHSMQLKNYQTSTAALTTATDTRLGVFGPSADPKRNKATNLPPRLKMEVKNVSKIRWKSALVGKVAPASLTWRECEKHSHKSWP